MNDPNKKIDVNLSSLMSLKAELLRKQAEVSKVKATRSSETFVPSKAKTYKKETITETTIKTGKENDTKVYEVEDSALLEKSQRVLQAKSKFYDRMAASGGQLNSDDNCLVLFNRKKQEDPHHVSIAQRYSSPDNTDSESEEESNIGPIHPDDEWVEYTDCLGRTRKCMRKDLELVKKKDTDLANSMPERLDQTQPNWMIDVVGKVPTESRATESIAGDGMSMMSKHDEMRNNWEKKEVENLSKENVHYQDVFFDEARQHGVGYYAFSTDEDERARQQKELEETRQKTLNEQAQREAQRNQREKIIAERVRAAKNRQRARLGLPPLEEEKPQEENTEDKPPAETKKERKQRKREEKQQRKKEKEEKEREEERQSHIRPWDREKNGVHVSTKSPEREEEPWAYRPDRNPMSQEQWNDHKRSERNPEFAPTAETPSRREYKRKERSSDGQTDQQYNKIPRTSFRAHDDDFTIPPPPLFMPTDDPTNFAPFQSTKKTKDFQRKNYSVYANESSEQTFESRTGVEIPPPLDLDAENYSSRPRPTSQALEDSIEAGLRFLRNNFDKNTMHNKDTWTAKSDY